MWVRKMKRGGWTGDGSVGLELRTQGGYGWDPGVAVGRLCGWRGHQGSEGPWGLNSFTVWLNTRCESRSWVWPSAMPSENCWTEGSGSEEGWGVLQSTLYSHKKAQLFLLGPEGRLYFSQWQATVCKKQVVSLSPWGEACESFLSLQSILWCCMLLSSSTNGDSGLDKNGPRQSSWSRTDAYINTYDILPWIKVKERREITC